MELPFVTLDVFTETRFRGNPVAIVTIPASGPKPTQQQKQTVAREFNLSETVFLHDVPDPAADSRRHIDIFLPFDEIPFAGHPTIGTAVALLGQGVTTLVTKAGPIALSQLGPRLVQATIPHDVHLHAKRPRDLSLSDAQLPAVAQIRELELNAPVFSIVNGVAFILIELPSLELLAQVEHISTPTPVDQILDDGWRKGFLGRYYYVRTDSRRHDNDQSVVSLRTRMMEHTFEDPATGSAACCLSSFLSTVRHEQDTPTRRYNITQGVEMGKESNIVVDVDMQDSIIHTVKLAGTAVQVMRGHILV
ncbi:phenazine biosynthesis-like protein [Hirsutella rhossiliensis]|uniref:Phenazine biosynthesis-like protein n=1 Tax=Hirsutella rhossiliensis TaxID=111463 RepID=A0A9P8MTB2_9HYPO|nr:phenazine biosynthesis-like protein [Hirsutella rhossiliensis]KAH0961613.1 phenazine biosynthesis-like protein [Hirsutella rhossiliensis]